MQVSVILYSGYQPRYLKGWSKSSIINYRINLKIGKDVCHMSRPSSWTVQESSLGHLPPQAVRSVRAAANDPSGAQNHRT